MPIVQHELKVIFDFDLLSNDSPFRKSILHYSDQHVHQDYENVESRNNEERVQQHPLRFVPHAEVSELLSQQNIVGVNVPNTPSESFVCQVFAFLCI